MFNPVQFFEAGKARSGTALIPIKNASTFAFYVSTRVGDYIVDKGDGSPPYLNVTLFPSKNIDFTSNFPVDNESIKTGGSLSYSPAFTGNVSLKFPQGLKDVYSLANNKFGNQGSKLNITDIETFFKQFPNLYSFYFNEVGSTAIIKGDLSKFPNSVERLYFYFTQVVNASIDLFLNLSNYDPTSKLKYFNISRIDSPLKILGDLGKTPSTLQFLNIQAVHAGSIITYTAGKIWASAFDTLSIPLSLTTAELDALLADMDGSILTKTGAGVISVLGYRSSASDAFVASLQSKGFTVNINSLQSFITDAVITDGTQISALNYLESNLKSAGLLDKMVAIYPFIGANENSHKRNLLNSKDNDTAFRLIFNTASHSANGFTCNYADTKFNHNNAIADNISVGVYSRTNSVNTGTDIAASIGVANNRFILYARYTGDSAVFDCYNASNERIVFSNTDSRGLFVLTRTANNVLKAYKNGILLGSNTNTRTNMFSGNIFISGFPGAAYSYTSRNYAFAFIGRGLSDTDVSNLQTIIQQYQTILSRAI